MSLFLDIATVLRYYLFVCEHKFYLRKIKEKTCTHSGNEGEEYAGRGHRR